MGGVSVYSILKNARKMGIGTSYNMVMFDKLANSISARLRFSVGQLVSKLLWLSLDDARQFHEIPLI